MAQDLRQVFLFVKTQGGGITADRPQKTHKQMKIIKVLLGRFDRKTQMQKRAQIGSALWPESAPLAQNINLFNLVSGRTKKIAPKDIVTICEILETSPNTLFEWDTPNTQS